MATRHTNTIVAALACAAMLAGTAAFAQENKPKKPKKDQYRFEDIVVAPATASEATRSTASAKRALDYIERGATAWMKNRKCVSCHTTGAYLQLRPALTQALGAPSGELRDFFVQELRKLQSTDRDKLKSGIRPTQVAYIAQGLAEWDAHVTRQRSAETETALALMFDLQSADGAWANADCWPPYESSAYHGATVAAMAAATAPGWLDDLKDPKLTAGVEKLKNYLRTTAPPHDFARLLLLWTSTRMPGLVDEKQHDELVQVIAKHQREDGGWSLRTFAAPEAWGGGNRAKKLLAEPNVDNPASDGHQTGLAVLVLREAGVPAGDARIQRAVKWLLANQRKSGRWWTRSLNTDTYHFITFSGTLYPLLALDKCDALPPLDEKTAAK